MKDKKQVYQDPEMKLICFNQDDIVTSSVNWNDGWNEDGWDNPDNTYIG